MRKLLIVNNIPSELDKYKVTQDEIASGNITSLMNNGRFIIIDIKDLNIVMVQTLIHYMARYRYKGYCMEELKQDIFIRIIPEGVLRYINNIDEIDDEIIDLSNYRLIVHIGDIHGCYDVLMEAWKKHYSDDCFYIFLGDFVDRGRQNDKVIEFLLSVYKMPNVLIIEGNHDTNLWNWSIDSYECLTKSFKETRLQLQNSNISKDLVKNLCLEFKEHVVYKHNEKTVLVSHGGLHHYPNSKFLIDTSDYICSQCHDYVDLDKLFCDTTTDPSIFQVHGHSNFLNKKSNASTRSINLEGGVEYGGNLRVATLSYSGFRCFYYKNKDSVMQNFFKLS